MYVRLFIGPELLSKKLLGLKMDLEPQFSIKFLNLGNFQARKTQLDIWKNL